MYVFGTTISVHIPAVKRRKWDPKAELGRFVGYGENTKGIRVYFPERNAVEVKRDVVVVIAKPEEQTEPNEEDIPLAELLKQTQTDAKTLEENVNAPIAPLNTPEVEEEQFFSPDVEGQQFFSSDVDGDQFFSPDESEGELEQPRRSTRQKKAPSWSKDFKTCFLSIESEPSTYQQAIQSDDSEKWRAAMEKEMKTLKENHTWDEIEESAVPKGHKIISTKWVYKIKNSESDLPQFKARLVARGFEQDNLSAAVYTPVAKLTTFRIFLAVANQKGFPVYQMDVTGAFLYGNIKQEVYVRLPENQIGKLNKSLYGLRESPKNWYERFDQFMYQENFVKSKNDLCLFYKIDCKYVTYVLIYVDDLLICGSDESKIVKFKNMLNDNFKMKDLGLASNFLGINIEQNLQQNEICINQNVYLKKVLEKFQMADCKSVDTPMERNFNLESLNKTCSESKEMENKCRQLIGSLLYACMGTRPDLCVAVSFLSRYQHCASSELFKCLKRILRYVKGTLNLNLVYKQNNSNELNGYVDADWAGDIRDRKSTTGYIFKMFDCPISWSSKKQLCVSLSSAEAEYVALSQSITEACWLKYILKDFGISCNITMFEDNQSAIKISENNENNKRLKHLDIRYHYIMENVTNKNVKLQYVKSNDNLADIFTKPLAKPQFTKLRDSFLVKMS